MNDLIQMIRYWLGIKHKHTFIPTLSDSGHPIEICWLCGGQDGDKFWAELNRLHAEKFPVLEEPSK